MFTAPELQSNESLKTFQSPDDLGKAYVDLHSKVSSGDVSLISEDLRKDPSLSSFKNVNDIAKSYVETKKLVGSIKKAPDSPEGYKFTKLENLHKGLQNVDGTQKVLASIMHEAGVHNEAADLIQQKILGVLSGSLSKQDEIKKQKSMELETELRKDWGADFDKNKDTVIKVLQRSGAEDVASLVGGNPAALKAMHKITSLLSEDSVGKLGDGGGMVSDKESAKKQIAVMIGEQWQNKKGAEYDKALSDWNKLHTIAYGE